MGGFIGRKISVGFGKETVRGTAVAPSVRCPAVAKSLEPKVSKVVDESAIGVIHDSNGQEIVKKRMEGDLEMNASVNAIGFLLYSIFGSITSAVDTTGAYKHTLNILNSNQAPSLTTAIADDVQDYRYPLTMLDSLEIDCKVEDYVKAKFSMKAKEGATSDDNPSYSADYAFVGKHVNVKLATNLAGLAAANSINCRMFNITIKKNLEEEYILGSAVPNDFTNSKVEITGSFEITYNDVSYRDMVFNNTIKALRLEVKDATTTIGLTSNPRLTIDLSKVIMSEIAKKQDNDSIVTQTITFKAHYSMSDAKAIVAELVNTTASY